VYEELSSMKVARYSPAIALLKDRFIISAGGSVSKAKYTNATEIFDAGTNQWMTLNSMHKPRGNTSMCAIANRHIFIFQGLQPNVSPTANNVLEYMDLDSCDLPSFKSAKWESITVMNQDFVLNEPTGSSQLTPNDIILFGGKGNFTYLFNFLNVI